MMEGSESPITDPCIRPNPMEGMKDMDMLQAVPNHPRIKVVVRKRPLNAKETRNGEGDCVVVEHETNRLIVSEPKVKVDLTKFIHNHDFVFDGVFGKDSSNFEIYTSCCQPLIQKLFLKSKVTCFAYGQTGSGKSYTMLGTGQDNPGMYAQAASDIFGVLRNPKYEFLCVEVSFYEIYGGKLFDLLNGRAPIVAREDGKHRVNIVNLTSVSCTNSQSLLNIIESGTGIRQTGSTGANDESSRSHAILVIDLKVKNTGKLHGRFSFIDLAGSERGADTYDNTKKTRKEGAEINKSLLALKECIRALDQESAHKPFRGSKLTQVLKESFIGDAYTLMIANIAPSQGSVEHTLNSLRYAYRVKELKSGRAGSKNNGAYMPHKNNAKSTRKSKIQVPRGKSLGGNRSRPTSVGSRSGSASNSRPTSADGRRRRHQSMISKPSRQSINSRMTNGSNTSALRRPTGSQKRRVIETVPAPQVKQPSAAAGQLVHPSITTAQQQNLGEGTLSAFARAPKLARTIELPKATCVQHPASQKMPLGNEYKRAPAGGRSVPVTHAPPLMCEDEEMAEPNLLVPCSFEEEDNLVKAHRAHIDDSMVLVKKDMHLLKQFDRMSINTEDYVKDLHQLIIRKKQSMDALILRLSKFSNSLQ